MTALWWRLALDEDGLSQGDIVIPVPVAVSVAPTKRLRRDNGRKNSEIWVPTDEQSWEHFLFKGGEFPVVVVSHSCELDKQKARMRVLVAPMRPLSTLRPDERANTLAQASRSLMPLPGVPGLAEDHCADLRLISAVPRELLSDDLRVASMSEEGRHRLQVQLVQFFTRIRSQEVEMLLATRAAEE